MKGLVMQYPYDESGKNSAYDGLEHSILPLSLYLVSIDGNDYFIMEYFDVSLNKPMVTLVFNLGDNFYKVPLTSYEAIDELKSMSTKVALNSVKLPKIIYLAETMSLRIDPSDVEIGERKPHLFLNEYVSIKNNNGLNSIGGVYRPSSCMIEAFSDEWNYNYEREILPEVVMHEIKEGANKYFVDEKGIKRYKFSVEFGKNVFVNSTIVDNDNKLKMLKKLVIPGVHEYNVVYADFIEKEDYETSKIAHKIKVTGANEKYYHDLHDQDKAFRNGGLRILDMHFYDYNNKEIVPENNSFNYNSSFNTSQRRKENVSLASIMDKYGLTMDELEKLTGITTYKLR